MRALPQNLGGPATQPASIPRPRASQDPSTCRSTHARSVSVRTDKKGSHNWTSRRNKWTDREIASCHRGTAPVSGNWDGMPPARILSAATLDGAEHLGLDNDFGSLAPGKIAELVVFKGDGCANLRVSEREKRSRHRWFGSEKRLKMAG